MIKCPCKKLIGGFYHEAYLHRTKRTSLSRSGTSPAEEPPSRQIWQIAAGLYQATPPRNLWILTRAQAKLNEYLHEIDVQATEMVQSIISDLAKKNGIDEKLKAIDPMRWVQEMNALKAAAEEIVLREIVYQ